MSFKDSIITLVRPKKFPLTIRNRVVAKNIPADKKVNFYLKFEYFTTDIEFKDYHSERNIEVSKTATNNGLSDFSFELNVKADTTSRIIESTKSNYITGLRVMRGIRKINCLQ